MLGYAKRVQLGDEPAKFIVKQTRTRFGRSTQPIAVCHDYGKRIGLILLISYLFSRSIPSQFTNWLIIVRKRLPGICQAIESALKTK